MAKPNVNTAGRDELLDAGVRADIVDEIMRRRRRKGGITLEALGEVKGVGPATLEQLGKTLDFKQPSSKAEGSDKPRRSRKERPASDRRDRAEQGTEAADLAATAGQGGAAAAGSAAETARSTVEAGMQTAGQEARAAQPAVEQATEAAEDVRHEAVQPSARDAPASGRSLLELLQEQSRENMAAMEALARAQGLDEVVRVQGGYLRGTAERMTELNRRWLEFAGTMWPTLRPGEDRGGRDEDDGTAR